VLAFKTTKKQEASLPGIRLEVRRPQHKFGVIYKPAPSFYRGAQNKKLSHLFVCIGFCFIYLSVNLT
jgi:hypothetical protein